MGSSSVVGPRGSGYNFRISTYRTWVELCAAVSNVGQGCSLYIAPVHLAIICMKEYLAIDSGR